MEVEVHPIHVVIKISQWIFFFLPSIRTNLITHTENYIYKNHHENKVIGQLHKGIFIGNLNQVLLWVNISGLISLNLVPPPFT